MPSAIREEWAYGLALYGEDGARLHQASVPVDWEPATEWLRVHALRRGLGGGEVFELGGDFSPVWDDALGAPYVEGFLGRLAMPATGASVEHRFPLRYLASNADALAQDLVREGGLEDGALFTYRGLAFVADAPAVEDASPRFSSRPLAPEVPVREGSLSKVRSRTDVIGAHDPLDVPVLIPPWVLAEVADLAGAAGEIETGGILIGHLRQDREEPEAFVEVTAQVPARGADADTTRLSFTPEIWTAVRAAIELRARDEIMVGWWHSHPVHAWCQDCPLQKQSACPLRSDFLSAHDRLLHRTVFPRAYSAALVVNELGEDRRTFSLFGPRDGRLEPRGYHLSHHDQEDG